MFQNLQESYFSTENKASVLLASGIIILSLMFLSTEFRLLYFITPKPTHHRFDSGCIEQTDTHLLLDRLMRGFMKERAHLGIMSEAVLQSLVCASTLKVIKYLELL